MSNTLSSDAVGGNLVQSLIMEKITYLFGAGASANVLPLIKENKPSGNVGLSAALENFVNEYKHFIVSNNSSKEDYFGKLVSVVKKCRIFGTPDLAAKNYLEIGDKDNYRLLKILLSIFFHTVEQSDNRTGIGFEGQNLDPRVVPFLTTISHKGKLPPGLSIISWNYDTQIEMGAKKLHPVNGIANDFSSRFHVWPCNNSKGFETEYILLHLNGICGSLYSDEHLGIANPFPFDFNRPFETLLSFAWEDDESFNKQKFTKRRIELAKKMIEKTTILVVIGYSFPFFNRKIDSELFSIIKPTLKKIYFQDPNLDGQFLYGQFGMHKTVTPAGISIGQKVTAIEHIKNIDQYYVPFEL